MGKTLAIYILFFVAAVSCLVAFTEIQYRIKYNKLGKLIYGLPSEKQHQGFFGHFLRGFVMFAVLVYVVYENEFGTDFSWNMILLELVISFVIVQFIKPALMYKKPYGIYENGAVTVVGAVLFSKCRRYGYNRHNKGGGWILVFQSNYDFLGGGSYLYVEKRNRAKYDKFLSSKCTYYEFAAK